MPKSYYNKLVEWWWPAPAPTPLEPREPVHDIRNDPELQRLNETIHLSESKCHVRSAPKGKKNKTKRK